MSKEDYERLSSELDGTRQRDHPRAYDTLSQEEKNVLQYWIEHTVQPSTKVEADYSSYGLKHEYERQTKLYVSNAQFKGAMLMAGYQPIKKSEQSWLFTIQPLHEEPHVAHQNQRAHEPTYRSVPQGEQDSQLDTLVQQALISRQRTIPS